MKFDSNEIYYSHFFFFLIYFWRFAFMLGIARRLSPTPLKNFFVEKCKPKIKITSFHNAKHKQKY